VQILKEINNEGFTGDLFIDFLNEFTQGRKKGATNEAFFRFVCH
jgi:hypothetical protein